MIPRINLHIILLLVSITSLFLFNWKYGTETVVFFGFAENKETEFRLEHAVTIDKIYVTPGKKVSKGELLMEVTRSSLQLAQSDLHHELAKLQSEYQLWESGLKAAISRFQSQKIAKENEINMQVDQLESEIAINKSLIKDLKSIQPIKDKSGLSPNEIRIAGLKKELKLSIVPVNREIRKLSRELNALDNPLKIQIDKLESKLGFANEEEEKLKHYAPEDGVIGSILCKEGEQLPAFSTLFTFYEENPTMVKGYVLENLIVHVNEGDLLEVHSGVQANTFCEGKVIGLGSRIVEIPERLRKIPTFRTYGREVSIEIPATNKFLQKEKVVLKLLSEESATSPIVKVFSFPQTSKKELSDKLQKAKL